MQLSKINPSGLAKHTHDLPSALNSGSAQLSKEIAVTVSPRSVHRADGSDSEAGFGFAGPTICISRVVTGAGTTIYSCCKMYALPVAVLFVVFVEVDIESGKAGE